MESRTQNAKRILIFSIIKYTTQMVLKFVLQTAFIYIMGSQYLGLNGLFTNIFQFLNLADLGLGSAIIYAMYKPIAENDIKKVNALQQFYKRFYLIIALIVLVVGFIITPFVKFFIKDEIVVPVNVYILFLMYLINSVASYFSAHKRTLLLAYQRNDIENKIMTVCLFGMTITQLCVLFAFKNYYIYFAVNICFTIIECFLIRIVANKLFPELKSSNKEELDKETKKDIFKNIVPISMHKIGGTLVGSTDNILISAMFGSVFVGIYANYALILSSISLILGIVGNALIGGVGNLISTKPKEYVYNNFKHINFIFSLLSAFCTVCLFVLLQPFIGWWTGRSGEVWLLSNSTVLLLCLAFYFSKMRNATTLFKDCNGLFWQDRWSPIFEAAINLVSSIVFARFMGIPGIFLGTIVSTLCAPFWVEPRVLYKHYFNKKLWPYFAKYLYNTLVMLGVGAVCYFVCSFIPTGGLWLLVAKFAACISLCAVLLILAYCWTKEFKESMVLLKQMLGFGKHKNK